jgi:hypothetical protein
MSRAWQVVTVAFWLMGWLIPQAQAQAQVDVCFDYGCRESARVQFSETDIDQLRGLLESQSGDPAGERLVLGLAIGRMYAIAAAQSSIWRDRARNFNDDRELAGAMDCIDHSTNSDSFLRLLAELGLLRHHKPASRELRFAFLVFGEHWAATVTETGTGARFAVDSWFVDPGYPAAVVALEKWKAGYDPDQIIEASR